MDYRQAKNIREKSFGTLLAEQKGGFGTSLKAAISQKSKARVTGLKEKFDPLNIAKTLTGGSNWAPAMLGKLFNVDKKRVDYFSGVKSKSTAKLESSESLNSPEAIECLGYIYKSLKQSADDKKLAAEQKRNKLEEEDSEEKTRNQEIVKALTGRFDKKKGEKPYRDEKGRFAKKPTENKPGTPPSFKPNPSRTTPTSPTPPTTTIVKPTPTPSVKPPATSSKTPSPTSIVPPLIAGGVAALSIPTVKAKISGHESAGSSDQSYNLMNKVGPLDNNVFPLTSMSIQQVLDLADSRSKKFGKKGAGAAAGKYQFMPNTLRGSVLKDGTKTTGIAESVFGKNWRDVPFSKENQEKLMDFMVEDHISFLKRNNIPVSEAAIYMVHFLGPKAQKIKAILYEAEPDTLMSTILGPTASEANPRIASMTVAEYRNILGTEEKDIFGKVKKPAFSFQPSDNNTGTKMDKSSSERRDSRADILQSNNKPAPVVSSTNINSQQSQPSSSTPQGNDRPAYVNKVRM